MTSPHKLRASRSIQRHRMGMGGISLIVVLLILLVVTVLGLAAAQVSMLGAKTTRYDRDRQVAWESAQAAQVDAQYDINSTLSAARAAMFAPDSRLGFVTGCGTVGTNQGLCLPSPVGVKPVAYSVDYTQTGDDAHSVALGTFTGRTFKTGSGIAPFQSPRYTIEVIDDQHAQPSLNSPATFPLPIAYRITAMGFGPRQDVQVVTQTVYRKGT